jgi:hypothetical protein
MLRQAKLKEQFWAEALRTATHTINRLPTMALPNNKTPFEVWTGMKPDLSRMRTFGCWAWAVTKLHGRSKLAPRAEKCILLGYVKKGYRLMRANSTDIIISRDVYFDEVNLPGIDPTPTGPPDEVTTWMDDDHDDNGSSTESTNEVEELDEGEEAESEHEHSDVDENDSLHNSDNEVAQPTPHCSTQIMNHNSTNAVDQPMS